MAPLLGGLALLASAAAGFASGNATWNEPSPSQQATTVVSAGPTPAPQNVDVAVERLDSRRIASRRELRAAKRPQGQARAARRLARAYEDARARVAKNGIEGPSEARLAHRLKAVEAAYRDLAKAAQSGDRARWKAARKATSTRESGLELLLRNREWN